jgi:hypothetical protein
MNARGLLFAVAGAVATTAMLGGCTGPTATQASLAPAQTLVQPQHCFFYCDHSALSVLPKKSTAQLNQQITLHDLLEICFKNSCYNSRVNAAWSSSGGSLQVIDGGEKAIFSASSPGPYSVSAVYEGFYATATVAVTSPLKGE